MADFTHDTRTFVIGDVHGSIKKLRTLLGLLPEGAKLVFVGDLIHKGAESKAVVDLVRTLVYEGRALVIRGNHEAMAGSAKWAEDEVGLTDDDRAWLKSRPLFLRLMDEGGDPNLFVHAGLDRGSCREILEGLIADGLLPAEGPWGEGMVNAAVASLSKSKQRKLEKVMFIRYLTADGTFIALKEGETDIDVEGAEWWAENYDGALGHIWYGHQPFPEVQIHPNAIGLDTEAYAEGGRLTAMDITSGETYSA